MRPSRALPSKRLDSLNPSGFCGEVLKEVFLWHVRTNFDNDDADMLDK